MPSVFGASVLCTELTSLRLLAVACSVPRCRAPMSHCDCGPALTTGSGQKGVEGRVEGTGSEQK
jgi:hypothetical protein